MTYEKVCEIRWSKVIDAIIVLSIYRSFLKLLKLFPIVFLDKLCFYTPQKNIFQSTVNDYWTKICQKS